jgi:type IV secretion system protein VirB5
MKAIKSLLARAFLCVSLALGGNAAHAGIPVIDVAAIAQALQEYLSSLTQIENQITQIESLQNQLTQLQQQYQAITGARNLGDILNSPALKNYVPADAVQTMTAVYANGYSSLSSSARTLRDASMTYNCADLVGADRTRCEASLAAPYQQKAFMQDGMQKANGRISQIESLMRQVGSSPDAKSAQELQSRIEAENALLQHEQSQINLARGMADADYRIAESQAREKQMQQASRTRRLAEFIPN